MKTRRARRALLTLPLAAVLRTPAAKAQQVWHPPQAPDDVQLGSEEMALRAVVKIVSAWAQGGVETGAGIMLGYGDGTLYLLTAAHVVRHPDLGSAAQIEVQFQHDIGRQHAARLLRYDARQDLAVILLASFYEPTVLDRLVKLPLDLAFRGDVAGQPIKALGHPGDSDWAVTRGRTLAAPGAGQIALSPDMVARGHSGGPVLSAENRLVGMVTGGEGTARGLGLTVDVIVRALERWGIPYRLRIVQPLRPALERIRKAMWEDDWSLLTAATLAENTNVRIWRASVSLLGTKRAVVYEWFGDRSYFEALGVHAQPAARDEAWRVWLRAVTSALPGEYEVKEPGPTRVQFTRHQAFAWPSSRRVTFELWMWRDSIYFHAYRFRPALDDTESGRMRLASHLGEYIGP